MIKLNLTGARMKRIIPSLMVSASLVILGGCSIYKAATAPPPIALENVKVGTNRINVVGTLGVPKSTETKNEQRIDVFEFVDGSPSASKARIMIYIAGDLFSIGLSELLFWPLELGLGQGTDGRAVVTYGMDDVAKAVLLTKADGTPWESASVEPEKPTTFPKSTNQLNPQTGAIIQSDLKL